jgi:adenylate cyclase class 2
MPIEIELKARIDDPQAVKEAISSLAHSEGAYEKNDVYWYPVNENSDVPPFGIRIRSESRCMYADGINADCIHTDSTHADDEKTETLVTYKVQTKKDGIEVNNEREFSISDAAPFEEILAMFGLKAGIGKHKKGWVWKDGGDPPLTAELSEVRHLGWFVELEILADGTDEETVTVARSRLLSFLQKIGIDESKIEKRYYVEMLKERGTGIGNRE